MTLRKTIVMLLLSAVLGGLLWRDARQRGRQADATRREAQIFAGFSAAAIDRLTVDCRRVGYSLLKRPLPQRSAGEWVLDDPLESPANNAEVERFLDTLVSLSAESSVDRAEPGAAEYGLDHPDLCIEVQQNGKRERVLFGKLHPMTQRRYLMREGSDRVFLVAEGYFLRLDRARDDLRGKRLAAKLDPGAVQQLCLRMRGPKGTIDGWRLRRSAKGSWFAEPGCGSGREGGIPVGDAPEQLLEDLAPLEAVSFLEGNEAEASATGLQSPRFSADLFVQTPESAPAMTLSVGNDVPDSANGRSVGESDNQWLNVEAGADADEFPDPAFVEISVTGRGRQEAVVGGTQLQTLRADTRRVIEAIRQKG